LGSILFFHFFLLKKCESIIEKGHVSVSAAFQNRVE
jgi:hypothetical protein